MCAFVGVMASVTGSSIAAPVAPPSVGTVTEYSSGITSGAGPHGIAVGPDGNIWFTERSGSRIGKITPAGVVTEYSTGISSGAQPYDIAAGPDGNMWFTEYGTHKIGKITPSGVVTEYSTGITSNAMPAGIAAGPDGNMWFTEVSGNRIGKITMAGVVTEYRTGISNNANPQFIAAGPDGNMWFTESGYNNARVAKITMSGTVTEYSTGITSNSAPWGIVAGPDGNMWFTETNGNKIGKITMAGSVTEYSSGITSSASLGGIAVGPDGNLWFTEYSTSKVGKITTAGSVTEYSSGITGFSGVTDIVAGPDGNMWFTESLGNRIGKIVAPADTTAPATPGSFTGVPSSPTTETSASIGFTLGETTGTVECRLDSGAWGACTRVSAMAGLMTLTGLAVGTHTVSVRHRDFANNVSQVGTSPSWTVVPDTTPPSPPGQFTGVPSSPTKETGATIGFSLGESGGTVECRLDSGSWGACSSVSGTSGSFSVSGLADGSHSISVRHTDAAGNVSTASTTSSWTVDTVKPGKPVLIGAPSSPTTGTSQNISWADVSDASGIARYECSVDGGEYSACTSPQARSGIAVGSRSLAVRAVDNAGNVGDAETASWTVQAPVVAPTILTPAAGAKTVYRTRVGDRNTWAIKVGLLFSTGGDDRAAAQILTVQVAVDGNGRPVAAKPSDSQPLPTAPTFAQGIVAWDASGEVTRQTVAAPVWVRVGNRLGQWTGWVKLTQ
ncbi:MAG: Ig-like domain-containing protein [Actinomycetes bacterium]